MKINNNLYNEESIQSLSPLEFTRLRPQVYCGSTEYSTQLLIEILSNSVDEYKAGHGNTIEVILNKSKITVIDNGQGFIPMSYREDGKTILEASFSVLNTSGKFNEDGVYEGVSLGLYGIGAKLPIFLSTNACVETYRDGLYEKIYFKDGIFSKRENGKLNHNSGTTVTWEPDSQFFTNTSVEIEAVKSYFNTITCLCPGLTIKLDNNGEQTEYFSKNGLDDYVDNKVGENEILKKRFHSQFKDGKNNLDFILTYITSYTSTIIPYVNTGLTEKGPHISAIKTLITREFNKFFREQKWIKEKEENLDGSDIQEGCYIVFNITAPGVAYDAQVKSTITKIDMKPFTEQLVEDLWIWLNANKTEIKNIADKAINARKAREAAKKAREAVRESGTKTKGLRAKMSISNKFIDCVNKNPKDRNLLLVEGLSAGSAAVEARNAKTDCIYMLRGKVISPLKTSIDKLLANQEISDIVKVIGAGFGKDFDLSKAQFDKIVITADQDSDGSDIELLLLTFFYTYMRPLVEAGKLYRAVTPLYIVKTKKEELYFYSDKELEEWKKTSRGSYDILRAKGLGELNPVDLRKVCFENERFKRITVSDAAAAVNLLEILQGQAVEPRKKFIYENANRLGFNFD